MKKASILFLFLFVFLFPQIVYSSSLNCSQVDGMAIFGYDGSTWTHIGAIGNEFNSLSIANEFGAGNEFKSTSIFNEFGKFGSEFSSYSAFNEFASTPPAIINNNYEFVGYISINSVKFPAINTYEAMSCAKNSFISPNRNMVDVVFKRLPSSGNYFDITASQQITCPSNSGINYSDRKCYCNPGYSSVNGVCSIINVTTQSLPDATVGKLYFTDINYSYGGSETPIIKFHNIPDGLNLESINISGYNGLFPLRLNAYKTGQFTLNGDVEVNYIKIGSYTFNIKVVAPPLVCQDGYTINFSGSCVTYNQSCQSTNNNDLNIIGAKGIDGKVTCNCVSGYTLSGNQCIKNTVVAEVPKPTLEKPKQLSTKVTQTKEIIIENRTTSINSNNSSIITNIPPSTSSLDATSTNNEIAMSEIKRHWYEWLNPLNWFK